VGGQIYVNGNVIIGGEVGTDADGNMVVEVGGAIFPSRLRGQLTVVATGNIWIVSPIVYAGSHDVAYEGGFLTKQVPSSTNQNVLGLFSQFGVVKVVDPGLSLNVPTTSQDVTAVYGPEQYSPIGYQNSLSPFIANRLLPPSMVVQAAITACGGGFGAENVGARLNANASGKDILIVAGSITESVQGRVAYINNGFRRCYYFDGRLLTGILPGDMWLQSKYVPTPGGWSDSRL
jgi:hypothetical protein